jgi:ferredoxin/flavodoxin---NADP+ reductase
VAYVITQNCCKDASCVPVCPVDCIRPVGGVGRSTDTEMLYIDPEACIDCGACMDECPVDAIHYEDDLPESLQRFKDINAAYFERHPLEAEIPQPTQKRPAVSPGALRVAIIGAGPAACYAASELIGIDGVEVDLFERLPTPHGLIRAGVAPDHQHTKSVVDIFEHVFTSTRLGTHLNVEIGRDLSHEDLIAHHHAVIYAVGATHSRDLGIPGEQLPGSHAASDFVGWYNGHPDHAGHEFDLSARRAVIIGNGNVAVDVARLLLMNAEHLASTDVAQHALDSLQDNMIDEVVILGRRGVRHAAFSAGEFMALGHLDGVDVRIDGDGDFDATAEDDVETTFKLDIAREYAARPITPGHKRIVFRFLASPVAFLGNDRVEGLSLVRNCTGDGGGLTLGGPAKDTASIETSLVFRAIGYCRSAIDGLPYDAGTRVIPNDRGRVTDDDHVPIPGVYVTGWIKRGPHGVIGTNRTCARETVTALLADFDNGVLARPVGGRDDLLAVMTQRNADPVTWAGWRAIDVTERNLGAAESRPRVKLVEIESMVAAAGVTRTRPMAQVAP